MAVAQTLFERLELKYWVDERTADAIRRQVEVYCLPDNHSPGSGKGYPLLSLYFDTATMLFHRAKARKDADRFKLRARVYGEDDPVHLEVKRKTNDIIRKTRVTVARDTWADAARGFGVPLKNTEKNRRNLDAFAHLVAQSGAEPKMFVRYEREAYESTVEEYARVTFDRKIAVAPADGWNLTWHGHDWTFVDSLRDSPESLSLVELKCETRMPTWLMEVIRTCELNRIGFSKYSSGIAALSARGHQDPIAWGFGGLEASGASHG